MTNAIQSFPRKVSKALKYYVYILSDPNTKEIFYVGKGVKNRAFSHIKDKLLSKKTKKIKSIKKSGKNTKIEILIHGLTEKEAFNIETATIDVLGLTNLTNTNKGTRSINHGRLSVEQIISKYRPKEAKITDPVVLIKVQKTFRYDMSPSEKYDFTRGVWRISPSKQGKIKYALCVFDNVVQEVYQVSGWFKAWTTFSIRKGDWKKKNRWEFVGKIAKDKIRNKYINKSVSKYYPLRDQNPIRYINIE